MMRYATSNCSASHRQVACSESVQMHSSLNRCQRCHRYYSATLLSKDTFFRHLLRKYEAYNKCCALSSTQHGNINYSNGNAVTHAYIFMLHLVAIPIYTAARFENSLSGPRTAAAAALNPQKKTLVTTTITQHTLADTTPVSEWAG